MSSRIYTTEEIDKVIHNLACFAATAGIFKPTYLGDAISLIQSLRQSQQAAPSAWIKISERLPTKEDADDQDLVAAFYRSEYTSGQGFINVGLFNDPTYAKRKDITHWRPLPAPPIPELTAEEKLAQEDDKAWANEISRMERGETWFRVNDDNKALFLAGRQSQRSQGGAK